MATCSALIPTPPFTVQGIEVEVTGDGPVEVGAVEIFVVEFPIVVVAGLVVTIDGDTMATGVPLLEADVTTDETRGAPLTPAALTFVASRGLGVANLEICVNNGVVDSAAVVMAMLLTGCAGGVTGAAAVVTWDDDFAMVVFMTGVLAVTTAVEVRLSSEVTEVLTAGDTAGFTWPSTVAVVFGTDTTVAVGF